MTFRNGDVYKGGFQNGMRHGVGRMLFAAGGWTAEYSGQWSGDTMDGTGRILFVSGDCYEGTFRKNQFQGAGLFKSSTGDVYSCLLYTSPSPRDGLLSRMPSSA